MAATHPPAHRRALLLVMLLTLCLLIIGLYQLRSHHLDTRLYFWARTHWHAEHWRDSSLWLPDYRVDLDAQPIDGVGSDLSGLAFDPDLDVIWAVNNQPNELYALSKSGELKGRYTLEGFEDVESIAYAGEGQLIIGEERRHTVLIVPVPANPDGTLRAEGSLQRHLYPTLTLALGDKNNKGLEGLGFDRRSDRLFLVRERDPLRLTEISGLLGSVNEGFALELREMSHWVRQRVLASDLSSVEFDPRSGHLLLLSDQSKRVIQITDQGEVVSYLSLRRSSAGLQDDIPQAEGLTVDDDGNIYMVSEPNLFYRFQPL